MSPSPADPAPGDAAHFPAGDERISLLPAEGRVRVSVDGVVLAESDEALLLVERGFPPRWYLPREDVRLELLRRTTTSTVCPFKGRASYWAYDPAGAQGLDVAWSYEDPVTSMTALEGLVCFYAERTDTVHDGGC